ncbi:hypothetical protein OG963_03980 [Streptomyces sp. NBC_01707]|uniref:hypothetical protein n=1 Tax=Streptomyces sp. NBC_01707 TaxID=2975914 RepID=UPI00352CF19B
MHSDTAMAAASWTLLRNGKLRVDEFSTEIIRIRQEFRMLVHRSSIESSRGALTVATRHPVASHAPVQPVFARAIG